MKRPPLLTFFAVWVAYALLVAHLWFLCDDAFISFRFARNLATGVGLRFNPDGPPVEGFSDPLWVGLEALLYRMGVLLPDAIPLLCFVCGSLLLYRVWGALRTVTGEGAAALALLAFALNPAMGAWSTGGLETTASALALFVGADELLLRPAPRAWVGATAVLCLSLLRVEGVGFALALCALAAFARPEHRRTIGAVLAALVLGWGGTEAARYAYYGRALPLTVTAKVALSPAFVLRGARYVARNLLESPASLVGLVGLPALATGLPARVGAAVAILLGGTLLFPVVSGGDYLPFGRFMVLALPLLALASGPLLARASRVGQLGTVAAVAAGMLPAFGASVLPEGARTALEFRLSDPGMTEVGMWSGELNDFRVRAEVGKAMEAHARPRAWMVTGSLGVIGWFAPRLNLYDQHGLVTPMVAEREIDPEALSIPGHDKRVDIFFFVDQKPDYLYAKLVVGTALRGATATYVRDLYARGLQDRYALAFIPLDPKEPNGPPRFLLVAESILAGDTTEGAWGRFEAQLRQYATG